MTNTNLTTVQQPIDYEALPLPFNHTPQLIQTLVKQLPDCWQQTIADEGKKHFAVSSQAYCEDFNQTMLDALPQEFEWQDVVAYRKLHNYSGAHKSRVILTRWKHRGKIKQIKSNTFIKLWGQETWKTKTLFTNSFAGSWNCWQRSSRNSERMEKSKL